MDQYLKKTEFMREKRKEQIQPCVNSRTGSSVSLGSAIPRFLGPQVEHFQVTAATKYIFPIILF